MVTVAIAILIYKNVTFTETFAIHLASRKCPKNSIKWTIVFYLPQPPSPSSAEFKTNSFMTEKIVLAKTYPLDTGRKLNVHNTFRRRPGRLLNVLCMFNLRPVLRGKKRNFLVSLHLYVSVSYFCHWYTTLLESLS